MVCNRKYKCYIYTQWYATESTCAISIEVLNGMHPEPITAHPDNSFKFLYFKSMMIKVARKLIISKLILEGRESEKLRVCEMGRTRTPIIRYHS